MKRGKTDISSSVMTMPQMARLAGVSVSTVSRALADNPLIAPETRQRIQELAKATGYSVNRAASSLRSKQSRVMAVIIPLIHEQDQNLYDPFMMAMLAHIADALSDAGYDLLLSKVRLHTDNWVEDLVHAQQAAGAILIGQSLEHYAIDHAARRGVPLAVWGARVEGQAYATVGSDNRLGGYLATRHLLQTGRRRLAFLGDRRVPEVSQRYEGFVQAHQEQGLSPPTELEIRSGFAPGQAFAAAQNLVVSGVAFDAIVAASDVIAISALRALSEAGRACPGDVAIVGFDDVEMAAYTTPPLTTVRQDLARGARLLVEAARTAALGDAPLSTEMAPELIVRGTT
jgi:DNA-binding LacI/PurR family transcriptional regulator